MTSKNRLSYELNKQKKSVFDVVSSRPSWGQKHATFHKPVDQSQYQDKEHGMYNFVSGGDVYLFK